MIPAVAELMPKL